MSADALLFLHLAGVLLFVGGGILASVLRVEALRRESPAEIATLLGAARRAVPLVGVGLLGAVGFGAWLASRLGLSGGETWLRVTYALLAWMAVVGALAGRSDRHTRELAERLARAGGDTAELRRRLADPVNLALNASMLAATLAVVAMMVWRP